MLCQTVYTQACPRDETHPLTRTADCKITEKGSQLEFENKGGDKRVYCSVHKCGSDSRPVCSNECIKEVLPKDINVPAGWTAICNAERAYAEDRRGGGSPGNPGNPSCRSTCSWCANEDQCGPAGGHVVPVCGPDVCDPGLGCCVGAGGNSLPNPALQRRAIESPSLDLFSKLDADGSKNIGVGDFFSWLRAFAAGDTAKCDFNGDGKCRVDDATLMFKYMGTTK
jgi:hypothetical protein